MFRNLLRLSFVAMFAVVLSVSGAQADRIALQGATLATAPSVSANGDDISLAAPQIDGVVTVLDVTAADRADVPKTIVLHNRGVGDVSGQVSEVVDPIGASDIEESLGGLAAFDMQEKEERRTFDRDETFPSRVFDSQRSEEQFPHWREEQPSRIDEEVGASGGVFDGLSSFDMQRSEEKIDPSGLADRLLSDEQGAGSAGATFDSQTGIILESSGPGGITSDPMKHELDELRRKEDVSGQRIVDVDSWGSGGN